MIDIQRIRSNINNHYKEKKEEYNKRRQKRRNDKWDKYYGSLQWKNLRNLYYNHHPLCEVCNAQGIVKPAENIHHIHKFSSGITEEARWRLLTNINNLVALCKEHHELAHKYMNEYNTDTADIEDIIRYEHEREVTANIQDI